MTDDQLIFILKGKLKQFYLEGKSVGLELKSLVAQFRQEIEDDLLNDRHQEEIRKRRFKTTLKHKQWPH